MIKVSRLVPCVKNGKTISYEAKVRYAKLKGFRHSGSKSHKILNTIVKQELVGVDYGRVIITPNGKIELL